MAKEGFNLEQHKATGQAIKRLMAELQQMNQEVAKHYPTRDWQCLTVTRNLQRAHSKLELARNALDVLLREEFPFIADNSIYGGKG